MASGVAARAMSRAVAPAVTSSLVLRLSRVEIRMVKGPRRASARKVTIGVVTCAR